MGRAVWLNDDALERLRRGEGENLLEACQGAVASCLQRYRLADRVDLGDATQQVALRIWQMESDEQEKLLRTPGHLWRHARTVVFSISRKEALRRSKALKKDVAERSQGPADILLARAEAEQHRSTIAAIRRELSGNALLVFDFFRAHPDATNVEAGLALSLTPATVNSYRYRIRDAGNKVRRHHDFLESERAFTARPGFSSAKQMLAKAEEWFDMFSAHLAIAVSFLAQIDDLLPTRHSREREDPLAVAEADERSAWEALEAARGQKKRFQEGCSLLHFARARFFRGLFRRDLSVSAVVRPLQESIDTLVTLREDGLLPGAVAPFCGTLLARLGLPQVGVRMVHEEAQDWHRHGQPQYARVGESAERRILRGGWACAHAGKQVKLRIPELGF
jgi:hypothetical protein